MNITVIGPRRYQDDRGWFAETWNARRAAEIGIDCRFVQDNHSMSRRTGTLRGLHYQAPPFAQHKLVRVVRGSVLDVAVDVRRGSPTFGRYVAEILSAENGLQLFVPIGYLHGFLTLEPDTEVVYKVSDFYDKASDGGIRWDDPTIGVPWGVAPDAIVLSPKDATAPLLADFESPFAYDGTPMSVVRVD